MPVTVFLLGRPGSGKSTTASQIMKLAHQKECPVTHIYDYAILYNWFMSELCNPKNTQKCFRPIELGGFEVIDFSVFRKALEEVERSARVCMSSRKKLVLIEFARDDYSEILKTFSNQFLQHAYFLFLNADLESCIKRVHDRSLHPATKHDRFVSEPFMTSYYCKDNKPYMLSQFAKDYSLERERVWVIDNVYSRDDFLQQIKEVVLALFKLEPELSSKVASVSDLSPRKLYNIGEPLSSLCSLHPLVLSRETGQLHHIYIPEQVVSHR